jgi:hypothetical protein
VQIQSGADPVRALTRQLSQLAGGFGIAIGTVVAIGGSLLTFLSDSADAEAAAAAPTRASAARCRGSQLSASSES